MDEPSGKHGNKSSGFSEGKTVSEAELSTYAFPIESLHKHHD